MANVDVMSVLEGAEKKEKGKSKVIEYPNRVQKVSDMVALDKKMSEIKASMEILKEEIRNLVEPYYLESEKSSSSLRVRGYGDDSLLITWQNKFNKIGIEMRNTLVEIVKDKYDELFSTKVTITVKEDADESLLEDLIKRIGPEDFKKFFDVKRSIVPTEKFVRERTKLLSKTQLEKVLEIVRQVVSFKPASG